MVQRTLRSGLLAAGLMLASAPALAAPSPDALIAAARDEMMVDPRAALAQAEQAQRLLTGRHDDAADLARATADWLRAEALSRLDDNATAAPLAAATLETVARRWPRAKLHADLVMSIGAIAKEQNRMADALVAFQRAHNLFRDIGETRSQAVALLMLAGLYHEASDDARALAYYRDALEVYHGEDQNLLVSIRNNRGNLFHALKRYDQALAEYLEAQRIARGMDAPRVLLPVVTNLARVHLSLGRTAEARRYLAQGQAIARAGAISDRPLRIVDARLAARRADWPRAAALIDSVFADADPADTAPSLGEAHRVAADVYPHVGRAPEALVHLTALKTIDDRTAQLATDTGNALMAARFDTANRELKIANLRAEEAQRSAELASTRNTLLGFTLFAVIAGTLLLGFGFVQLRRSRNRVRAANVDLAASNVALEKALQAKSDFLATTSHEFRTPLNGILGMTQVLLADRDMPERARPRLEILHDAGKAMHALVEDVLDIALLDTGKVSLTTAPFDCRALLTGLATRWQSEAQAAGLAFAADLAGCPGMIEGDARRVRQLIGHLLSNAVKFTPTGSVTLAARRSDGAVEIAVTDTGIGIPADQHGLIFDKFHQVDAGTARRYGGVGVGLSVARNLAAAMGGSIALQSAPGQGSAFRVRLPLREASAPAEPAANGVALAQASLLLVDPNALTRSVTLHGLKPLAGTVEAVADCDAAQARLAQGGVHHLIVQAEAGTPEALRSLATAAARAGAVATILHAPAATADLAASGARLLAKPIALPALAAALQPDAPAPDPTARAA